jgi:hypothetical protein
MIFFNKIQDFIIAQPLDEKFSFVAKQRNQNGGLIQDGNENIFLFFRS